MQVSVEKISNIERKLTIIVPSSQVEEAYLSQINRFAKNANIKGFRPGKAPRSYIEQRYGQDARNEALSNVIQKAFYDAITEHKLRPVSTPRITPKTMLANEPLEFVASFEVMPEIDQVQFSMDKIQKLQVEILPNDIEYVLDQLKKQYTKWHKVERSAQENDRVVIDYKVIFEGETIEDTAKDFPLELGSKKMIAGFEQGLIGSNAGDEKVLKLNFPTDFADQTRAGKPVEFVVNVKEIFEAESPQLNEEFVKTLGVKSGQIEDLRQQIQHSLEQERDRLVKEKLKEQVFRNLLEQNPLEVPQALIEQEAKNIHDEVYPSHQHHNHHEHHENEMNMFNDIAKKRVLLGILMTEYAKKAALKVDKTLVSQRIEEIAQAYENPKEVAEWLSSKERLQGIEAQVMEDQVLNKLIEGIPTEETQMSYAELKGIRS